MNETHTSPVFIIAPTMRSGTHYLRQLLINSKLCVRPQREVVFAEDFLLKHSRLLREYCEQTVRLWVKRGWVKDSKSIRQRMLLSFIGDGLRSYVKSGKDTDIPVVVNTPSTENIELFRELFPNSPMLVLVRDGRDVVESFVMAGWLGRNFTSYALATWHWIQATKKLTYYLNNLSEMEAEVRKPLVLKYEDLVLDPVGELGRIAEYLGMPSPEIDKDELTNMPVYGSSQLSEKKENRWKWLNFDSWKWQIKEKPKNFKPIGRWQHWPDRRIALFNYMAGQQNKELGYIE